MRIFLQNLLFTLIIFSATAASAQLTAGFTASPTSGCAPLLVNFTNTTTPSAGTTYSWVFGSSGGGISTLTNPSRVFATPGTHLVTLTATNGSSVSTFSSTITVHPQPTVNFTASATSVCPGTPITFTSTTLGGVTGAVTCTWNWGDGGTSTGSPATHTFPGPGSYTVTLFATNAMGCQASLVMPAYITVHVPPDAAIATPGGACNPPAAVSFSSTSTAGSGALGTYAWSFGDGGIGAGSPTSHTYATSGLYTAKLVVTDANGCKDSAIAAITIATISATFTSPDNACEFASVTFSNTSSPHGSRTWNFGDGGTSTAYDGVHAYSSPGTYTVTLTIVNGPCTATYTRTITILPGPATDFSIAPIHPCPAPETITYTASGPAGTTYSWLFEGSTTATGSPASHTYGTNGVKTIRMIAVNPANGCRDTVTKRDTLYDLFFDAFASPRRGCVPLTVTFGGNALTTVPPPGTSIYPLPVATYSWDFGDGTTPGTGPAPIHTYTAIGIYTATVTITTSNGCTAIDTLRIEVGAPPVVTFTATPRHVCYGAHTPIIFTPVIVTGPVDEYHWSFGDGGGIIYDTANPPDDVAHTYTVPGTFDVTVRPYWRGCPGAPYTLSDYIIIDSPKAIMGDSVFCSPPSRVKFWDSSMGDDTHLWMFGDGTTSTLDDPIHDYSSLGTYTISLATYNIASGCRDTVSRTINLSAPVPDFTASATEICRGQNITFTSVITGGFATNYYWHVDGFTAIPGATNPTYTRPFALVTDTGYHTISLVIRNSNGCLDTITKTNFVHVNSPSVSFTGSPVTGCVPLSVTFTDASTAVSATTISSRFWRFGDGTTGTGTPVTHSYALAGTYMVTEVVTDSRGCIDSLRRPAYIVATKPTASFSASTVYPCIGAPVVFTNTSPGAVSSVWDFGDGGTSTVTSPSHSYSGIGVYTVRLTVTDVNGCVDDTIMTGYINVTRPDANFSMSDSVSVCPPLFVNFTNLSTGAAIYSWTLGDGGFSTALSPSNMYITSGLYNVMLVATNIHGCKDTVQKAVNIFGYAGAFSYTPLEGCAPLTVHFVATLSNVPFITWDFSDGVTSTISFTDTISHTYLTPGAFIPKLVLSDNTGCQTSSIGIDTIKVDAVTAKFVTDPNPVCIGMPFSFIDSSTFFWSPITSWEWTYDGLTSTLNSPGHTIYTPGTYPVTFRVVNGWGCVGTASGDVVVDPPPVVTASPDTVVCVSDPATLFGYGAVTYTWEAPATLSCTACNPTYATPLTETTYTVTGTDARGCTDTASVTVRLRTHTTSRAWGDTAVCQGVSVQIFDTGGTSYLWLPPNGLNSNTIFNPIATPDYTTIYTVIAKLAGCIPDTNTVTVVIYPLPTVYAGPDQRLLAGSTAQLEAKGTNIASYMWWPGETLSCTDCYNPVASMSVMTTYNVDVLSDRGCKASDSVTVMLYCDNSQVFIPNAFTPNGDGQNDVFYPRGMGLKQIKTFRIYNRWGELLFERTGINLNDASSGWDGSYKGDTPKPDVYVYILEAVCYTGEDISIKGDVSILR